MKIYSKFWSFWTILVICNTKWFKSYPSGWFYLSPQIALETLCNEQIAEPNPNEHVLAGALQENLPLSPKIYFNFLHYVHIFLALRQDFLTIIWIFLQGLLYKYMCLCWVAHRWQPQKDRYNNLFSYEKIPTENVFKVGHMLTLIL